jgi:membrane associated rhomboid family serine protease
MTPTPVGMRCPECARQRTRVASGPAAFGQSSRAPATFVLIAINVVVYLITIVSGPGGLSNPNGTLLLDYGLFGPFVAEGEWYRLLSSGFLHRELLHIGFNMFALYFLGRLLEPGIGTPRFVAVYFASLLGGSFGALLLSPDSLTIGASGAVFGIFGATFVIARARGIDALASSIGLIIGLNLLISLTLPNISLGGHLGGLAAGVICALAILAGEREMLGARHFPAEMAAMVAVGVVSVLGALAVA